MKVVINSCHGGFGLSDLAFEKLLDRKGIAWEKQENAYFTDVDYYHAGHLDDSDYFLNFYDYTNDDNRADQDLVAVVEELGELANGQYAELKVIEVPDEVEWHVEEFDGFEWIAEDHRTWQ